MDEYGEYHDAVNPDDEWTLRGGCIRISDGTHSEPDAEGFRTNPGLKILANFAHNCTGLTQVRIDPSGHIRIDTDGARNGAPIVVPDETLVRKDISVGVSGGSPWLTCRFYRAGVFIDLSDQATYDEVAANECNLWVFAASQLVRGVGLPSKADRALTLIADLEARVAALEGATVARGEANDGRA